MTDNIFTEVMTLTEHTDNNVSVLLNNDFFQQLDKDEQAQLMNSLYVLALDKLANDMEMNVDDSSVKISVDPTHKNFRMVLKFLVNDEGEFNLLAYFGGAVNPAITINQGLLHAMQVVTFLKS